MSEMLNGGMMETAIPPHEVPINETNIKIIAPFETPSNELEMNEIQFTGELRTYLKSLGLSTVEVLMAGFDGGDDVATTIQEPKEMIRAYNFGTWDNKFKTRSSWFEFHSPLAMYENQDTPCLGVYDSNLLQPSYLNGVKHKHLLIPTYEPISGNNVQDALRIVLTFRK